MRKGEHVMEKYRKVIGILLSGVLLMGCADGNKMTDVSEIQPQESVRKDWKYEFHYGSDYWNHFDFDNSFIPTQADYENLVSEYIPQIEDIVGTDWYMDYMPEADTIFVNMEIGDTPISYAYQTSKGAGGTIEISHLLSSRQLNAPVDKVLPHELTHSILGTGKCFSNSLEEGLCEYVGVRLGVHFSDFYEQYDIDIMDCLYCGTKDGMERQYDKVKMDEMLDSVGRCGGYTYSIQTDDGIIWYSCSQCFIEYLAKNYGMEKTMRLIREGKGEEDYRTYLGIAFDDLKKGWITYFENYEPMHTLDEYKQMSKSFLAGIQSP